MKSPISITRNLRNTDTKSFVEVQFEPSCVEILDYVDLISVNCKAGGFVNLSTEAPEFKVDLALRSTYLQSRGIPDVLVRLSQDKGGNVEMAFIERKEFRNDQQYFLETMGMLLVTEEDVEKAKKEGKKNVVQIDELTPFKLALATDVVATFSQLFAESGKDSEDCKQKFGVSLKKKGGATHRVVFEPSAPLLANHLALVEICLDLSSFIDLKNKPKKGKKLLKARNDLTIELKKQGLSSDEINKQVAEVEVTDPIYDLMLNLYSNQVAGLEVALGMYTQPNDVVKFSNGSEDNFYNQDFYNLGATMKNVPEFKELLNAEVLAVLEQLQIKTLDNTIQGLGLEEPWAKNPAEAISDERIGIAV